MFNQKYTLRYLPLFDEELESAVLYIAYKKKSPKAAQDLMNNVEKAIIGDMRRFHQKENMSILIIASMWEII